MDLYLSQMRFGILPLRIETERFEGKAEADRLYIFCKFNTNSVETEIHLKFVFRVHFMQSIEIYTSVKYARYILTLKEWSLTASYVY